ncbi:MAG: hypothetical protein GY797_22605 [Deltaproteobacteria bacterium]|nr:hypothetical protein [Deltaproteobacteria bacterium]
MNRLNEPWAIIIAALIGFIGVLVTGYFVIRASQEPFRLSLQATQTIEAKLTSEVLLAVTPTDTPVPPTNTPVPEDSNDTSIVEPTDTLTPKPSNTSTPTPKPVNTPKPSTFTPTRQPTNTPSPTATQILPGTILFEEDFEDGKAQLFQHWTEGRYKITTDEKGNNIYEIDKSGGSIYPGMYFGSPQWRNYAVEYSFRLWEIEADSRVLLGFRVNSEEDAYRLTYFAQQNELVVANDPYGDKWQRLGTQKMNFADGLWYSVRVEVQDTKIKVYVDDSLIIDITDSLYEGCIPIFTLKRCD